MKPGRLPSERTSWRIVTAVVAIMAALAGFGAGMAWQDVRQGQEAAR